MALDAAACIAGLLPTPPTLPGIHKILLLRFIIYDKIAPNLLTMA